MPQSICLVAASSILSHTAGPDLFEEKPLSVEKQLTVDAIDHVTLVVADLERSQQFFAGVLGMREVPRPDFGFPGLWFEAGSTQIHLNVAGEQAGDAGLTYRCGNITRALHIAFEVPDVNEAANILTEHGIQIIAGPRNRPDGAAQLYILDPDGHQIELTSSSST